jgi:3-hydroxyisobutyrate dehydrogenase-like beta-hydroxyacid dehydrogenase
MGKRMCKNILGAGYPLVVFNRSRPPVEELVAMGAKAASSAQEVARSSGIVILCLPTSQASRDVIIGKEGIVDHLAKGSVVMDMSTIDPELVAEIDKRLSEKGCYFLDAPVSGGPEGAEKGTLTIMVGGDKAAFDRCAAILQRLGRSVFYLGPSGSGERMKLVNQTLCVSYAMATAEAYLWSKRMGVSPDDMLKVISTSWGDSPIFRRCIELLKAANADNDSAAPLRLLEKDISIVLSTAKKGDVPMPVTTRAHGILAQAVEDGEGQKGLASLASIILEQAGRANP